MIEKDIESKQMYLSLFVVLSCVILLCLSCSTVISPLETHAKTPDDPNGLTDKEQRARDVAMNSARKAVTAGFRPSLEMKENVDFLLTPALLIQEALSEDMLITYPSE